MTPDNTERENSFIGLIAFDSPVVLLLADLFSFSLNAFRSVLLSLSLSLSMQPITHFQIGVSISTDAASEKWKASTEGNQAELLEKKKEIFRSCK